MCVDIRLKSERKVARAQTDTSGLDRNSSPNVQRYKQTGRRTLCLYVCRCVRFFFFHFFRGFAEYRILGRYFVFGESLHYRNLSDILTLRMRNLLSYWSVVLLVALPFCFANTCHLQPFDLRTEYLLNRLASRLLAEIFVEAER